MSTTIFGTLDIARSGMRTHHTWLDAIADNIANVNTVVPTDEDAFQARYVEAVSLNRAQTDRGVGGGVGVNRILTGSPDGILKYDPTNPLADELGYVRAPDMDMAEQMSAMMLAQRAYQASISSMQRATEAYQTALRIGQGI